MGCDGFINILKPPGMTSHDIVAWVRACLGVSRAGHLGTLDPAAAGVLPVSVGRATRLFQFAGGPDKGYRAEIIFGIRTDTLDAEGQVVSTGDGSSLTEPDLGRMLCSFVGELEQTPPSFSAAKVGGVRSHQKARAGMPTKGRPRRVTIRSLDLVDFVSGERARATLDVVCSTGTYVRVLADDLGVAAGCGAYLHFLLRTRAGRFELASAFTLEELAECWERRGPDACVLPPDWPLAHLPKLHLGGAGARSFVHGRSLFAGRAETWPIRVYGPEATFLGLGEVLGGGRLQPKVVLAGEGATQT